MLLHMFAVNWASTVQGYESRQNVAKELEGCVFAPYAILLLRPHHAKIRSGQPRLQGDFLEYSEHEEVGDKGFTHVFFNGCLHNFLEPGEALARAAGLLREVRFYHVPRCLSEGGACFVLTRRVVDWSGLSREHPYVLPHPAAEGGRGLPMELVVL